MTLKFQDIEYECKMQRHALPSNDQIFDHAYAEIHNLMTRNNDNDDEYECKNRWQSHGVPRGYEGLVSQT